jgi:putative glutamine amidotransferase
MPPRIAIPLPHSIDTAYSYRALPQYERAVEFAGGDPVVIPFDLAEAKKLIADCDGVLLPGSNADVDPAKFHASRSPHTAAADPGRDAVDELLLQDAYHLRKPVLGICYGLQSLNVFRVGSLVQHIPDFLLEVIRGKVNHEAGKSVAIAHTVEIESGSLLARIVSGSASVAETPIKKESGIAEMEGLRHAKSTDHAGLPERPTIIVPVNSSHHQAADTVGEGLRVVARCPDDGIIEAVEGTSSDHFVLAVQWHPERSVEDDSASQAIFRALVKAAR